MELLTKFLERFAPAWLPYVYLIAFLGLVVFIFVRTYVVTRDMLRTNEDLGERMKAAEERIDVLESDRDKLQERVEAAKELLDRILDEVMATPRKIADSINAAARHER